MQTRLFRNIFFKYLDLLKPQKHLKIFLARNFFTQMCVHCTYLSYFTLFEYYTAENWPVLSKNRSSCDFSNGWQSCTRSHNSNRLSSGVLPKIYNVNSCFTWDSIIPCVVLVTVARQLFLSWRWEIHLQCCVLCWCVDNWIQAFFLYGLSIKKTWQFLTH